MSSRLPTCTAREVLAALERAGWIVVHRKGSHHQLKHPDKPGKRVTVALHPGDMPRGTLQRILAQTGLTDEQFRRLL